MKDATLSCHEVSLTVGSRHILDRASLVLPLAGMTILRGHNGAGKTCFLRALMGLLPLQGGQLRLDGRTPEQARRHCGYMPQKADEAAPMIPVLSHVTACLPRPQAKPWWHLPQPGRARREAMALLAATGAEALASRPLGALSGGERQRVALAQALAGRPELLILDEPFAALDDAGRHGLLQLFTRLHREQDVNLLLTIHGPLATGALSLPVREVTLEGGKLHA